MLDQNLTDTAKVIAQFKKKTPKGEPHDTELLSDNGDGKIVVRVIERKTGLAQTHALARDLFESARTTGSSRASTRSC